MDFDLRPGEIHALLGENGAGKSTLMNILRGHLRPTGGQIFVRGKAARIASPADATRLGIGMVHQHFLLVPVLSVLENLTLSDPETRFILQPRKVAARAEKICNRLGWRISLDARVADLPVGTQQRVEILRVLLADPSILLFDEPTAVLAPSEIEELFGVLRVLASEGRSVVFVSHKLGEVTSLCDRVTVLRRGRVTGRVEIADTDARDLARRMVGGDGDIAEGETASAPPQAGAVPRVPVLRIVNLSSPRRHKDEVALADISLEVAPGEILGIAGVDGNGQTELFEALARLRPFRAARFEMPPGRSGTALIPPDRRRQGLALSLSVAENLTLDAVHLPEYRRGPFLRRRALQELAARLAVEYDVRAVDLRQPAGSLSGGNQQKIVIARALWRSPRLLVAVSPTRGLDVAAAAYVHNRLRQARDGGAAVILISTELDEVQALASRIAVLYEGRIAGTLEPTASRDAIGLLMGGHRDA
ncbi:MAG: ABC transporter ATP-binding protein [Capsulimonadaceae bacterium]|nr:ABC transporter ATP-binding protein [Capsulimonadaceae bacterium]